MTRKSAPRHVSRLDDATQPERQPAPALSKVTNICLRQLALSPANVRKTPSTTAEDAELEASIRAKGILQNLIVHPTPIDGRGVYEVDAGGRRLKVLQKLAAEGVIDNDHPVPCLVREPAASLETSLMENTIRAAMHPADEFVAMAALIDGGATIDAVAKRFGTSERHVKQRLRLGKLAPELLDAYRNGDISLDAVTAFTLGADHAAQLAVWNQLKSNSYIQPYTVKRLLTESAVPLDSDLGMFVGAEAYEAAGGKVTTDLFRSDEDGFLDDAVLVRRLAIEKLEAKAEELRPQWAWTKAVLDPEHGFLAQYARVTPKRGDVPAELATELEQNETRCAQIDNMLEVEWDEDLAAEGARLEDRRTEIDEIIEGLAVFAKKDRKRAGCIVTIGDDGRFELHQGLIERSAASAEDDADEFDGDGEDDDDTLTSPRATRDAENIRSSVDAEQALRKECGFSQSLVDDLKAHRLQITRAHLAENFEVAFDLALYTLCVDLLEHYGYRSRALDLRATENQPRSSMNDLAGTGADRWLATERQVLELDWLKLPPAEGFAVLAALAREEKQRLFAWCIAATLKPQLAIEGRADPVIEAAGRRLAIGFEDYWRPTSGNYWGVKKAHSLAIGREILGERWARDHADDKKPVLAAALETAFDPAKSTACIGLNQAARDSAAAWLPPGMNYGDRADTAFTDPAFDEPASDIDGDAEDRPLDVEAADLPAFLTEDEPVALNGAAAD
jgi:ParB family transcriptional regulator, chromosome partitioning protein